ncbi:hypothetical protein Lal_00017123 [Lupinus albus]|nr:hypothetical protein Lal_00017123 [Lupinus albus]
MPYPKGYITSQLGNRLIYDELNYDTNELKDNFNLLFQSLTELAGLLKQTKLIIWDEAPMSHKFFFDALDKSLGDITSTTTDDSITFGEKILVFDGDFRQILPNMCLQNDDATEIREFSEWILKVGDGKLSEPNDGCVEVDIPDELLILHFDNPIEAIESSTYPDLHLHYNDE